MDTTFSILPKVSIEELPVLNVKTKQIEIFPVPELFYGEDIFNWRVSRQEGLNPTLVRGFMMSEIEDRLEEYKTGNGVNELLGLPESPPRFVWIDGVRDWIELTAGTNVKAKFFITRINYGTHSVDNINNRPIQELTFTRIFLSAPLKIRYNKCEFFEPNPSDLLYTTWEDKKIEASCGFQYFYSEFGHKSNYSKFFGNTKCDDVVQKIKGWAGTDPPQYQEWLSFYKGSQFIRNQKISKIKPVPEWIDTDTLIRDHPQFKVIEFNNPEYTSKEEYNSLNLLDIVKLCMWARLNLTMTDDLDQVYLSYIDDHFTHPKGKRKKKGAVVVKIIDNHGYFVKDANVKHSATNRSIRFDGMYETGEPQTNKSKCNNVEDDFTKTTWFKHPLAKFKHGDLQLEWDEIDWNKIDCEEERIRVCSKFRNEKIQEECRKEAPPTPEELISAISGENHTSVFIGNSQLNGFVDWMMRYKGVKPDNCRGSAHNIHKATYGKLSVSAYHKHPITRYTPDQMIDRQNKGGDLLNCRDNTAWNEFKYPDYKPATYQKRDPETGEVFEALVGGEEGVEDGAYNHKIAGEEYQKELECWKWWKNNYPELKTKSIPTPSAMADAIYNKEYPQGREFNSRFNLGMRDIFYTGENKPDFRIEKPSDNDSRYGFSLDFSKAYTNGMKLMDCEWSVFDAIDEPRKFKKFNENNFYLCRNNGRAPGQPLLSRRSYFPIKRYKVAEGLKDKTLVLYHGCFLRHLLGKGVEPIYEIASHKKLPSDYFVRFTEKCYEIAGNGRDNVVSGKSLVNNFIGTLKRKDGICDYRLTINQDKFKSQQNLLEGYIVSNLNDNSKFRWRGNTYLTAKSNYKYHYQSGQPIRLQVIDKINEMNLLLWNAYKQALRPYPNLYKPHLCMVKTDALYIEYPCKTPMAAELADYRNWKFNPDNILEEINKELPEGYEVKVERLVIGLNRASDFGGHDRALIRAGRAEDGYCFENSLHASPKPEPTQQSIRLKRNTWNEVWDINHKWKVSACPAIIKSICVMGGALVMGEAGTGKTELARAMDDISEHNRKLYRWVRLFYKLTQPSSCYQLCEDWRDTNPVYIRKYAPTNKACNNIKGKTLHKGLGLRFKIEDPILSDDEEEEDDEPAPVDYMEKIVDSMAGDPNKNKPRIDIILIDEISMIGGELWSALNYIKLRIPTIKFILCGDILRQLPPVKEEDREFESSLVIKELTDHNKINLHYNFRRQGNQNELWEDWSIHPERFIETSADAAPIRDRNLCFTNKKRKEIIDKVQDSRPHALLLECKNIKDFNSDKGQQKILAIDLNTPLIARKSMSKLGVAKNEIWRVKNINKKKKILTLKFKDKEDIAIEFKDCIKWFLSAYCITIHKSQGDTYKDEYTIHQWGMLSGDTPFKRRLRYVAQSRSTNPQELVDYKY